MKFIIFHFLIALVFSINITKFTISSYIFPNKTLHMQMDVLAPNVPNKYPPILYLTGLSGLAPYFMQAHVLEAIASQGYIVMTASKLQSPLPQHMEKVLTHVINWLNDNIQIYLNKNVPGGVIADLQDQFILMGHSAAAHVTTLYLNQTCGTVKLQILLDGVDGVDPFGIKNDYVTHPGQFLPYMTPVLVLQTQLDPVPRAKFQPPCAADNISNMRYYNAMKGPKWFLNVSKYGHVDFFNDEYRVVASVMCSVCQKNCNFNQYRSLVTDIVVNFIEAILHKDQKKLQWIENGQFSIPTIHMHDYMGYKPLEGGFCYHDSTKIKNLLTQS